MRSISTPLEAVAALRELPQHVVSRAAQTAIEADGRWKEAYQAGVPSYGRRDSGSLANVSAWVRDTDVLVTVTVEPAFSNISPVQLHIAIAEGAIVDLAKAACTMADVKPSLVITGAKAALTPPVSAPATRRRDNVQWEDC